MSYMSEWIYSEEELREAERKGIESFHISSFL